MWNHYFGEWQAGQRVGEGVFYYATGAVYAGGWQNDMKHGWGLYTGEDGTRVSGKFERDRLIAPDPADDGGGRRRAGRSDGGGEGRRRLQLLEAEDARPQGGAVAVRAADAPQAPRVGAELRLAQPQPAARRRADGAVEAEVVFAEADFGRRRVAPV